MIISYPLVRASVVQYLVKSADLVPCNAFFLVTTRRLAPTLQSSTLMFPLTAHVAIQRTKNSSPAYASATYTIFHPAHAPATYRIFHPAHAPATYSILLLYGTLCFYSVKDGGPLGTAAAYTQTLCMY